MNLPTDGDAAALLVRSMYANAAFSGISGLVLLVAGGPIAALLGIPALPLWPLGAALLGYAAWLAAMARRPAIDSRVAGFVIAADVAWVLGTVVLLAGWGRLFTPQGFWIVAAIGAIVLVFAERQFFGLRRLKRAIVTAT